MSANDEKILITGATGVQGGALARTLFGLGRGRAVRALTRRPDAAAARALADAGAEVVAGDLLDRPSLDRALAGVDAVFAVGTPYESGPDAEIRQGVTLVDAARAAGVGHFVYSSVGGADRRTGIPHFESKRRVEEHLSESGLPYTIVAPVFFMENAFSPWALPALKSGAVARALPAGRKLQQVAIGDLAELSAAVLSRRAEHLGKRLDVASDEQTGRDEVAILARVLGRDVAYQEIPIAQLRARSEDLALMFEWFDRVGYSADVPALRAGYPEVSWHTFESWARAQDWAAAR